MLILFFKFEIKIYFFVSFGFSSFFARPISESFDRKNNSDKAANSPASIVENDFDKYIYTAPAINTNPTMVVTIPFLNKRFIFASF